MIDAHLDLAWNALSYGRDITRPLTSINDYERGMSDCPSRGHATVCLPEMRRAGIGICVGTLLARVKPQVRPAAGHARIGIDYPTAPMAAAAAMGQLAYYDWLEREGHIRRLRTASDVRTHWANHAVDPHKIGLILAMEGADPIIAPDDAPAWFVRGLRVVNLVHRGQNAYAVGTSEEGPLTAAGIELLKQFEDLGVIVDTTHLSDASFFQTLDIFSGPVIASHNNCRTLAPHQRQFSDEQLRLLIEREGVIGVVFNNWMLVPGWKTGVTPRSAATIELLAEHVDHICQLAGDAQHVAIGSDLDGGFGSEETPMGVDSIADVPRLADALAGRGYPTEDIAAIFAGNWLRFFSTHLPQ